MNIEVLAILVAAYLVGVIVALVFLAWINSDGKDGIPEVIACLSWAFLVATVVWGIVYFVTRPFNWFYEKMLRQFRYGVRDK
jgi:hypothetical protein